MRVRAALGFWLIAWPSAAPAEQFRYTYTRHDFPACPEAKSPHPDVVEVRVCKGLAGIDVRLTSEPDSASIGFGRSAIPETLGLGAFHQPSDTVEWRGAADGGRPFAAIVRYRHGEGVGALTRSTLVVYRLEPSGRSCVMAAVAEPGANVRARAVADSRAAAFRCGQSARIAR